MNDGRSLRTQLLIDGHWRDAASGDRFEVREPSTGDLITRVANAGAEDAREAVLGASVALPGWARLAPASRYAILQRAVSLLAEREQALSALVVRETGKPLVEALGEVRGSIRFFDFFSHETLRLPGQYWPSVQADRDAYVTPEPVGVVGAITPWNFPAFMVACKVGAALAAGCTVVLKPAAQTPLVALAIAEAFQDAGLPAGVLQVVPTSRASEVGGVLVDSPVVRCITFTGSTGVGQQLLLGAAPGVKRVLLELGGNAPVIVTEDAKLEQVVGDIVRARFSNAGQACVAANRIYVHRGIADAFLECLVPAVRALRVGDPWQAETDIGPLIDLRAVETMEDQISRAVAAGATMLTGGGRLGGTGTSAFLDPGVLLIEHGSNPVLREEFFGPTASVVVTDGDEDAIRQANDSSYGLSAYVFAGDETRGRRIAERLHSGNVGVNCALISDPALPFGGVRMSGLGRERGRVGVEEFLETKTIQVGRAVVAAAPDGGAE